MCALWTVALCVPARAEPPPSHSEPRDTVLCCGLPFPDGRGVIQAPDLYNRREVELLGGCVPFDIGPRRARETPTGLLRMAGQPLYDLTVSDARVCTTSPSAHVASWIEGALSWGGIEGVVDGVISGCGAEAMFGSDGHFRAEVIDTDCTLNVLAFLHSGTSVSGSVRLEESRDGTLVPNEVSRSHRGAVTTSAVLHRTARGALIQIRERAGDQPPEDSRIPAYYKGYLPDGFHGISHGANLSHSTVRHLCTPTR